MGRICVDSVSHSETAATDLCPGGTAQESSKVLRGIVLRMLMVSEKIELKIQPHRENSRRLLTKIQPYPGHSRHLLSGIHLSLFQMDLW